MFVFIEKRNYEAPHYGGYNKLIKVKCKDLKEASKLYREAIEEENFGASDLCFQDSGLVVDLNGKFLASISYNGKIWDNKDFVKAKEIII